MNSLKCIFVSMWCHPSNFIIGMCHLCQTSLPETPFLNKSENQPMIFYCPIISWGIIDLQKSNHLKIEIRKSKTNNRIDEPVNKRKKNKMKKTTKRSASRTVFMYIATTHTNWQTVTNEFRQLRKKKKKIYHFDLSSIHWILSKVGIHKSINQQK